MIHSLILLIAVIFIFTLIYLINSSSTKWTHMISNDEMETIWFTYFNKYELWSFFIGLQAERYTYMSNSERKQRNKYYNMMIKSI